MLSIPRSVAILAILSGTPVISGNPTLRENAKSMPEAPARASDGAFKAMLVLTDDWDGFIKRWEHPSARFEVPVVQSIEKGQPTISAVIFTGCKPDQSGNCSVIGDYQVIDPRGKTYADRRGANIWRSQPPDPEFQLSVESLGLKLDPRDPTGSYIVRARITDRVARKTLELSTTLEAR